MQIFFLLVSLSSECSVLSEWTCMEAVITALRQWVKTLHVHVLFTLFFEPTHSVIPGWLQRE